MRMSAAGEHTWEHRDSLVATEPTEKASGKSLILGTADARTESGGQQDCPMGD